MEKSIAVLKGKTIRRTLHNNKWWFVIVDVVSALTDSVNPNGYTKDMRRRDEELSQGWGQIATPLSIKTEGGPQKINCANTEGIFRIIQSIPSPKAEPFKRWLTKLLINERLETAYLQRVQSYVKSFPHPWLSEVKGNL